MCGIHRADSDVVLSSTTDLLSGFLHHRFRQIDSRDVSVWSDRFRGRKKDRPLASCHVKNVGSARDPSEFDEAVAEVREEPGADAVVGGGGSAKDTGDSLPPLCQIRNLTSAHDLTPGPLSPLAPRRTAVAEQVLRRIMASRVQCCTSQESRIQFGYPSRDDPTPLGARHAGSGSVPRSRRADAPVLEDSQDVLCRIAGAVRRQRRGRRGRGGDRVRVLATDGGGKLVRSRSRG